MPKKKKQPEATTAPETTQPEATTAPEPKSNGKNPKRFNTNVSFGMKIYKKGSFVPKDLIGKINEKHYS